MENVPSSAVFQCWPHSCYSLCLPLLTFASFGHARTGAHLFCSSSFQSPLSRIAPGLNPLFPLHDAHAPAPLVLELELCKLSSSQTSLCFNWVTRFTDGRAHALDEQIM